MSSESEGGNDRERGRERDRGERTYLLVAMLSYLIPSQRHLFSVHFPIQLLVTSIFAGSLLYYLRFIALQQGPSSPTVHIGHMVGQLLVFPDFQCVCFLGGLGAWTCYWSCPGQIMWQSLACMHLFSLAILPNSHTPFPIQKN